MKIYLARVDFNESDGYDFNNDYSIILGGFTTREKAEERIEQSSKTELERYLSEDSCTSSEEEIDKIKQSFEVEKLGDRIHVNYENDYRMKVWGEYYIEEIELID